MRGTHNSKRISWAPEVKLCQVRLFLSEEAPSQVGLNAQDHLQVKSLWMPNSNGTASDDAFPPGFEGAHSANQPHIQLSEIPLVKWICPPRFELNICWQVVAGEESKEVDIQNRREMRVLEAFYPCESDIPPNASVLVDVNNLPHNEQKIPLIPITPIEDEDSPCEFMTPVSVSMSSQSALVNGTPPHSCSIPTLPNAFTMEKETAGMVGNVMPDVVAAASAAFTAMGRSNEPGSLFDHELLIKILSTPKLIEKLVAESGTSSTEHPIPIPKTSSHFAPLPLPPSALTSSDPSSVQMPRPENGAPLVVATSRGSYYPPPPHPNGVGLVVPFPDARMGTGRVSTPPVGVPQARDVNYYKNLIQRHGGERQEVPQQYVNSIEQHGGERQEQHPHPHQYNYLIQQHGDGRREAPQQFVGRYKYQHEMMNNPKARDSKHKINKVCAYFNSPRGCRHGNKCAFQHDANTQQRNNNIDSEGQSAKRMKFGRD